MKYYLLLLGDVFGIALAIVGGFLFFVSIISFPGAHKPIPAESTWLVWAGCGVLVLLVGVLLKIASDLKRSFDSTNAQYAQLFIASDSLRRTAEKRATFIRQFGSQEAVFTRLCNIAEEYLTQCQGAPKLCSDWTYDDGGLSSIDDFSREFGRTHSRVRQAAEDFTKAADSAALGKWGVFTLNEYLEHQSNLTEFLAKRGQEAEEVRKAEGAKKNVIEQ